MKGVRPLVVRGWVQAVKGAGCDEVWTIRGVCGCRGVQGFGCRRGSAGVNTGWVGARCARW